MDHLRDGADMTGIIQGLLASIGVAAPGQDAYTTAGTYTWIAPAGVTSVSAVCVGGGGGGENYYGSGGGGGALAYANNISVTPGSSYTVVVGAAGVRDTATATGVNGTDGGDSSFINTSTVAAGGGKRGRSYTGDNNIRIADGGTVIAGTGGAGGAGNGVYGAGGKVYTGAGGGGAGGYSGTGGRGGGAASAGGTYNLATAGSGGGGGGGNGNVFSSANVNFGGGGGVGILGSGSDGAAGASGTRNGGGGGSGGTAGGNGAVSGSNNNNGGAYGGGGGSGFGNNSTTAGNGAVGAVRIIWPGNARQFPSTRTADE
jgi:hypothetical protein